MHLLIDANLVAPNFVEVARGGPRNSPCGRYWNAQGVRRIDPGACCCSGPGGVTADTDFGELLAVSGASRPSVVLLRSADHLTPDQQASMLAANLPAVAEELEAGAVVSMARGRLRVRPLPMRRD